VRHPDIHHPFDKILRVSFHSGWVDNDPFSQLRRDAISITWKKKKKKLDSKSFIFKKKENKITLDETGPVSVNGLVGRALDDILHWQNPGRDLHKLIGESQSPARQLLRNLFKKEKKIKD